MIDPGKWYIRCKHCGEIFNLLSMMLKYRDRQHDMPKGKVYVKCPGCGIEDQLTDPNVRFGRKDRLT